MRTNSLLGLFLVACTGEVAKDDNTGDSAEEDTAGGGGTADTWKASGTGYAYFGDGSADNSMFTLVMSRAYEPRDDEAYHGFVSTGADDWTSVGEIVVNGEDVDYTFDIGSNAIIAGFSHFEAWANGTGEVGVGDPVWSGNVDPTVFDVIQNMLIASSATPDGQGSLRALESHLEFLIAAAASAEGAGLTDAESATLCEKIGNALQDPPEDADGDGTIETYENTMAVQGDDGEGGYGYVELIIDDLGAANSVVEPTDPIHSHIEQAYDGVQFTDFWAEKAAADARAGANTTAASALTKLAEVVEQLSWTLVGADIDEDGVLEEDTESGIDYSIDQVSQMARMSVDVAK